MGKKCSGVPCASSHGGGRPCRGRLYDAVLDWEHSLPENDLLMSEWHSRLVIHFTGMLNLSLKTIDYCFVS